MLASGKGTLPGGECRSNDDARPLHRLSRTDFTCTLSKVMTHNRPASLVMHASRGAALALAVAAFTATAGCEQQPSDDIRGGGYVEPPAKPEPSAEIPGQSSQARSALGKAKERAERLVNEDVAEYNKKIEDAAEGKIP
jgi:hypothetical protein